MTIADLVSLKGRKILLTGAAGHLAPVLAETLLELGGELCLTDRDAAKVGAVAEKLGLDDKHWLSADLTHEGDMNTIVDFAADRLLGLDGIIHAAALTGTGPGIRANWAVPFEDQGLEAFEYSTKLGLSAAFAMAKSLKAEKRFGEPGVMVIVSSIYGLVGPQPSLYEGIEGIGQAPAGYAAAKAGQIGLVRYLASVLGPNIRVNGLIPGGLLRGQPEEFVRRYSERTPLGRMGTEDDLRGAIAFLCSDMSAYVTGQVLQVDGGWTVW